MKEGKAIELGDMTGIPRWPQGNTMQDVIVRPMINGEYADLVGASALQVELRLACDKYKGIPVTDPRIEQGKIVFTVRGEDQYYPGLYKLVVSYLLPGNVLRTYGGYPFIIAPVGASAGGGSCCPEIELPQLELSLEIDICSGTIPSGPGDHDRLNNRELDDQHPIDAITGLRKALEETQETLISGVNIKTINGQSVLGQGDISISGSARILSFEEQPSGTLITEGRELPLYRRLFELSGLPSSKGESREYVLDNEPLGASVYLSAGNMVVKDSAGNFLPANYAVTGLHVDAQGQTKLVLRCDIESPAELTALVEVEYIKNEVISFEVILPEGVSGEDISFEMPPLKYGKRFAYSYTFDDDVVQAYGKAFCTINKKWVDNERFFHVGQTETTGAVPSKTLGYTDGCGKERRFTFDVAIWPNWGNDIIDSFMDPTGKKADKYYPYLVWNDLVPLLDFGNSICLHNVDERVYDKTSAASVVHGIGADVATTLGRTGRMMKVLARPDGNNVYITAGRDSRHVAFMMSENTTDLGQPPLRIDLGADVDLFKQTQYRRFTEPIANVEELMKEITESAQSGRYTWWHDFSHAPAEFQYILDLFAAMNDTYGKDGDDTIWFASTEEIYDYWFIRRNSTIRKTVSGNIVTLDVSLPALSHACFKDFSLLIGGLPAGTVVNGTSRNIYGLSYGAVAEGMLVNVNYNPSLPELAEKYTSLFEQSQEDADRQDALYFVDQLKPELQEPFRERLGDDPPTQNFTVTGRSNNDQFGTVTPALQQVAPGATAHLTASARPGYMIDIWSGATSYTGVGLSTGTADVSDVRENRTVTCHFIQEPSQNPKKAVICFNPNYTEKGMNCININMSNVVIDTTEGAAFLTYVRQENKPMQATVYQADETPGAPYAYEAYKMPLSYYSNSSDGSGKNAILFTCNNALSTYRVRLYCNTKNTAAADTSDMIYAVNGMEKSPNFQIIGNVDNYLVFDNVQCVDGAIKIEMWATKAWTAVVVNVIEIEQI